MIVDWNGSDLEKIAAAEELDLASERGNGTLRAPVTMRVVRSGDHLYVRSVKGPAGPWYRGARSRNRGRIEAGGVRQDVTFHRADPGENPEVDAAHRKKYGHCPSIVEQNHGHEAHQAG